MVRTIIVDSDTSHICYKTYTSANTHVYQITTQVNHLNFKVSGPSSAQKQIKPKKLGKKSNKRDTPHEGRKVSKKALLIGIRYDELAKKVEPLPEDCGLSTVKLPNTHSDPPALKQLLIDIYGYLEEDISILMDDGKHVYPSRSNIIRAMKQLVKGAKAGDHFVVLYSGHGSQVPNLNHTEKDGYDEVIWPADIVFDPSREYGKDVQNFIKDDELKRILVDSLPADTYLNVIFDCCHSGSALDLPHSRTSSSSSLASLVTSELSCESNFPMTPPAQQQFLAAPMTNSPYCALPKGKKHRLHMPFSSRSRTLLSPVVNEYHELSHEITHLEREAVGHLELKTSKHVVSWSTCTDDEEGIDAPTGGALTQSIVKILREVHDRLSKPITHSDLLALLFNEIQKLDDEANKYLAEEHIDVQAFQQPVMSSLSRIDKISETPFTF